MMALRAGRRARCLNGLLVNADYELGVFLEEMEKEGNGEIGRRIAMSVSGDAGMSRCCSNC